MYQKFNFNQVIDEIVLRNGCSRTTADLFLKALFTIIVDQLREGDSVSINGLGEFKKNIDKEDLVQFIIDKKLAQFLNQPFSYFEPIELAQNISEEVLNENTEELETKVDDGLINEFVKDELKEDFEPEEDKESLLIKEVSDAEVDNGLEITQAVEYQERIESIEEQIVVRVEEDKDEENNDNVENINTNNNERKNTNWWKYCLIFILGFAIGYIAQGLIEIDITKDAHISVNKEQVKDENLILSDTLNSLQQDDKSGLVKDANVIIVDTITNKRFLTTMAREHYGNLHFWVYIYEENKSILGHPDKIKPGTEVVIPSKEKYNINPTDEELIKTARIKATEIYASYAK